MWALRAFCKKSPPHLVANASGALRPSLAVRSPSLKKCVGWAKARRAVPTAFRTVGTRSLSSGAHLRDPLALPTLRTNREILFSRRVASESCKQIALTERRGRRECRVMASPMARLQQKSRRQSPQVQPDQPAFPAQWFYGLYVVSPVNRAFLSPSPRGSLRAI